MQCKFANNENIDDKAFVMRINSMKPLQNCENGNLILNECLGYNLFELASDCARKAEALSYIK